MELDPEPEEHNRAAENWRAMYEVLKTELATARDVAMKALLELQETRWDIKGEMPAWNETIEGRSLRRVIVAMRLLKTILPGQQARAVCRVCGGDFTTAPHGCDCDAKESRELSAHGIPAGENDPGWPEGTPEHVKR